MKKMVRRMKLRWLRLHYVRLVKKMKGFYCNLVKEFVDAGGELEAIQTQMAVEAAAFAVPAGCQWQTLWVAINAAEVETTDSPWIADLLIRQAG